MSQKNANDGLLPIKLIKMADRSVQGFLPDGQVVTWPADYTNKPTPSQSRVMINSFHWAPVWIDASTLDTPYALSHKRHDVAQIAFEAYDFFGPDDHFSCINETSGWDTSCPLDFTRMAYGHKGRFNFHVGFEVLTSTVTLVQAYDMATGDVVGSMPMNLDTLNGKPKQIRAIDVAEQLNELLQIEQNLLRRQVLEAAYQQLLCIQKVHKALDAQEYDSETSGNIANLLTDVGFEIRDIDEIEDPENDQ